MTVRTFGLVMFVLASLALPTLAQKLSPEEQKIVAYIDAHKADAVTLLEKVVNIESPTQNLAGVKQVGQVFKAEFDALGFKTKWIEMPLEMKRAGHLLAEHGGTKGKRLLLIGHIDTVLFGEKFRRDGGKAYGTGGADMKGGTVVLLYALKALHDTGALKDTQLIVMLTGDEESPGDPLEHSRGPMVTAAKRSDIALSFEGAKGGKATVGRRGASFWQLEVTGATGHSSQIFKPSMGSGAIFEAARILNQFYEQLHAEKDMTFNPAVIVGGTDVELKGPNGTATGKDNVVPQKVIISGDLRFISEEKKQFARTKMREIVAKNLPSTTAKIIFEEGMPSMFPSEGNYALLRQLSQVSEDLGFGTVGTVDPADRGAGDIAFISDLISSLDGLGTDGAGAHAPGETVDLESMPKLIQRAAVLIYRLTR